MKSLVGGIGIGRPKLYGGTSGLAAGPLEVERRGHRMKSLDPDRFAEAMIPSVSHASAG